jgi:hypothetical protein
VRFALLSEAEPDPMTSVRRMQQGIATFFAKNTKGRRQKGQLMWNSDLGDAAFHRRKTQKNSSIFLSLFSPAIFNPAPCNPPFPRSLQETTSQFLKFQFV